MSAQPAHPIFKTNDRVTVRTGKTVWTVCETYREGEHTNLVLSADRERCVEHARDCKAA